MVPIKVLALVTDAFGGRGGIAQYNRDLLTALSAHPDCKEIVAVPRVMPDAVGSLPENLRYSTGGLNGKLKYLREILRVRGGDYDLIICGHINLTPAAFLAGLTSRAPILLLIFGIDAWRPSESSLTNYLTKKVDAFISISDFTRKKFFAWAGAAGKQSFILPNAIDQSQFGHGAKNPALIEKYGLKNKVVLLTLGRMESSERYKGFDEILEILPDLAKEIPELVYMIAGTGDDRVRLEQKAKTLGVEERVVFPGFIPEAEKADHYRLADAYVMPSYGEGFGFVFLEAMACGVPVVAGQVDGGREAVRDGRLGILVDPKEPKDIKAGISEALSRPKGIIPDGLEYFYYEHFEKRLHRIIDTMLKNSGNRGEAIE